MPPKPKYTRNEVAIAAFNIIKKDGKCKIISEDGIFLMDSIEIEFEGDL